MRAGRLDRTISLLASAGSEPDRFGNVAETWTPAGTFRASIVTMSTEEFLRASGEASETMIVFRTRYLPDIANTMRVVFEGRTFDLKETKEIGRREGLELRCQEVRT